jgi:hypothetical protein
LKEENQKEKPPFNHQNNLFQKWINERFDFEKCFMRDLAFQIAYIFLK